MGVNLGANLPGVTLTLLVLGWVGSSIGVLVGSLFASDDRVVGLCVLVSLLMGALGGCWWPLEIAPPALQTVALCLPTGWALKALHQLISFGSGFEAVVAPVAEESAAEAVDIEAEAKVRATHGSPLQNEVSVEEAAVETEATPEIELLEDAESEPEAEEEAPRYDESGPQQLSMF